MLFACLLNLEMPADADTVSTHSDRGGKTMWKLTGWGLAFGILSLSAAQSNEPADFEGLSPSQAAMYLHGAAEAFGVMNRALQTQGRPALFCPPADFHLTAAALYELADSKLGGAFPAFLFTVAGLDALQERYPCPQQ